MTRKKIKLPPWLPKGVSQLEYDLTEILSHHCGERGNSEGAEETLCRIIRERNAAMNKLALLTMEEYFRIVITAPAQIPCPIIPSRRARR